MADDIRWIAQEESYPIVTTDHSGALFPDGSSVAVCTNWAIYARRILGTRAEIYGFMVEDNPKATEMAEYADGHDFVVVDDRYILDGWITNVIGIAKNPLLDMRDPDNRAFLHAVYGDRSCWTRGTDIEQFLSNETRERRASALRGVGQASQKRVSAAQAPHLARRGSALVAHRV